MPVSHIGLTVSHLPTSCSFFLSALQPLGYRFIGQQGNQIGLGINGDADFFLCQETPGIKAGAAHIAFSAPDRITVRDFYTAALTAGGRPNGSPATRDAENGVFNAAILDFDGNSIEVVCRENESADARSTHEYGRVLTWRQAVSNLDDARSVYSAASAKSASKSLVVPYSDAPKSAAPSVPARSIAPSVVARSEAPSLIRANTAPAPATSSSVDANLMGDAGARKIIGTLIGAAAGAAVAYAMVKSERESAREEASVYAASQSGSQKAPSVKAPSVAPSQAKSAYPPSAYDQQMVQYQREPSQRDYSETESFYSSPHERRAIEAAPPRSSHAPTVISALRSGATTVRQGHRNFSDTDSYYSTADRDPYRRSLESAPATAKSYHSPTYVSVPNTRIEDAGYVAASTVGPRSAMRSVTAPSEISSIPSTIKASSQAPSKAPSQSPSKAPSQAPSKASSKAPSLISSFVPDDDNRSAAPSERRSSASSIHSSHTVKSKKSLVSVPEKEENPRDDYPPSLERQSSAGSMASYRSSKSKAQSSTSKHSRSRAGSEAPDTPVSSSKAASLISSVLGRDRNSGSQASTPRGDEPSHYFDDVDTVAPSDSISNAGSARSRHSSRAYAPSDAGSSHSRHSSHSKHSSTSSRHSSKSKSRHHGDNDDGDGRSRVSSRSHKSSSSSSRRGEDVVHPDNISEPSDASTIKPYKKDKERKDSVVSLPVGSGRTGSVASAKRSVVSYAA